MKSPLDKHNSRNYFQQESSVDDKTSEQNIIKNRYLRILKVSPYKTFTHYKEKI